MNKNDYQANAYNENAIIEMLQEVDGETLESIIRGIGMENQMLRQLIMKASMNDVQDLVEEKALLELGISDEDQSWICSLKYLATQK